MKSISIHYFALLRDQANCENEEVETTCETLGDLYHFLKEKYDFSLPLEMVQVAVNDEFSSHTNLINNGDKIVFIPPVAGG